MAPGAITAGWEGEKIPRRRRIFLPREGGRAHGAAKEPTPSWGRAPKHFFRCSEPRAKKDRHRAPRAFHEVKWEVWKGSGNRFCPGRRRDVAKALQGLSGVFLRTLLAEEEFP